MAGSLQPSVTAGDIEAACERIAGVVRRTPVLPSATVSSRYGADVVLKAENLQRVGSFKARGAANRVAALGARCARGVTCGSAGNHAQALAFAARERGIPCVVVMPKGAPISKVEAAEALGATVVLHGVSVDECVTESQRLAGRDGLEFVHPFDNADVVAGQGTVGLELLEDVADLSTVVVPVGGGGLISGLAVAVKSARPEVRVVGVQVDRVASFPASLEAGEPLTVGREFTIADGIAVKRPGELTLALVREHVDEIVTVSEDETADAMVVLLEKAKLVVEGAGAVGVAALIGGQVRPDSRGTTVAVLSGGNVDPGLVAELARRHESQAGRRHVLFARISDRPGSLAALLEHVAAGGASIVDIGHVREGIGLHVGETGVQLVLETRSREHADTVVAGLTGAGYVITRGPLID